MSRQRYMDAIRSLCGLLEVEGPEAIFDGAPLEFGDVMFSLLYGADVTPNAIIAYCDFGEIPLGKEIDVYQSLLQNNFIMYNGTGPCFGISPDTGRVILALHYDLATAPQRLHDSLLKVAECVGQWRTHHFLGAHASYSAQEPAKSRG